ncbi:DUF2795 domain-containing protein [Micromonospora sp. NBC_01813]|uniref:DUF2795 domain-containing protein n=1 Tax=Micromonospora sp. NBC_01813 TaxID=2975988 RepID=UPI002DDA828E|nr:DUF2795 domain-containing protein [Micromonospora sp. NBC_01813]WSA11064.1 DUF2795 domain-containing protein [Micromonospora sp. NBC_01813]
MERGNSKHGPRVDDAMAQEIRGTTQGVAGGRAEEWHEAEPPGEDQPEPTTVPAGDNRSGTPQGMTSEDVEQRSRLGRYINLTALPGDRATLRRSAEDNEAPADVLDEIDQLPAGRTFQTVSEVWAELGHANETTRW